MLPERCGAQMLNSRVRKSGCSCDLDRGHAGGHASQYSEDGQKARIRRHQLTHGGRVVFRTDRKFENQTFIGHTVTAWRNGEILERQFVSKRGEPSPGQVRQDMEARLG